MIGISSKRFPDIVAYPERGVASSRYGIPSVRYRRAETKGIIARFDLPSKDVNADS